MQLKRGDRHDADTLDVKEPVVVIDIPGIRTLWLFGHAQIVRVYGASVTTADRQSGGSFQTAKTKELKMTPQEARNIAASKLTIAEQARGVLLEALSESWLKRSDELIRKAVIDQPEVTKQMDVADLATLKFNLSTAVDSANSSIPASFGPELDIAKLAGRVRRNQSGYVRPTWSAQEAKLGENLYGLLSAAGYNMQRLRAGKGNYSHSQFTSSDIDLRAYEQLSVFNTAVEAYGRALLDLADAEHTVAAREAENIWDGLPDR
jgi:hypothetical protein